MTPSEEELRAWLTQTAHDFALFAHMSRKHRLEDDAVSWDAGERRYKAVLALLDAARKDRELLAGVQRVEMDMREDGERVCWDGVAGTFCFSDGTCHAESIAAMGLDIMRRDP